MKEKVIGFLKSFGFEALESLKTFGAGIAGLVIGLVIIALTIKLASGQAHIPMIAARIQDLLLLVAAYKLGEQIRKHLKF